MVIDTLIAAKKAMNSPKDREVALELGYQRTSDWVLIPVRNRGGADQQPVGERVSLIYPIFRTGQTDQNWSGCRRPVLALSAAVRRNCPPGAFPFG
jgi:hypothetical protein